MSLFQDIKLRIKNTFLELVDEEESQPTIIRSQTDSVALRKRSYAPEGSGHKGEEEEEVDEESSLQLNQGVETEATAAVAFSLTPTEDPAPGCRASSEKTDRQQGGSSVAAACKTLPTPCKAGRPAPAAGKENRVEEAHGLRTTVMLRNLPNDYTRDMLLELLDTHGFLGRYDFVYLPIDFERKAGLGYAFVNMTTPADAHQIHRRFEGFKRWAVRSGKVCSVGWSKPCQGLHANLEYFKNSSVMHPSVPDEFKPVMLCSGQRVEFPRPTKKLRVPEGTKTARKPIR